MYFESWLKVRCHNCKKLNWIYQEQPNEFDAFICWKCDRCFNLDNGIEVDPDYCYCSEGLKKPSNYS